MVMISYSTPVLVVLFNFYMNNWRASPSMLTVIHGVGVSLDMEPPSGSRFRKQLKLVLLSHASFFSFFLFVDLASVSTALNYKKQLPNWCLFQSSRNKVILPVEA